MIKINLLSLTAQCWQLLLLMTTTVYYILFYIHRWFGKNWKQNYIESEYSYNSIIKRVPKLTATNVPVLPIPAEQCTHMGTSSNTSLKARTHSTKSRKGLVSSGTPKSGHEWYLQNDRFKTVDCHGWRIRNENRGCPSVLPLLPFFPFFPLLSTYHKW